MEDVERFRKRARRWIEDNLRPVSGAQFGGLRDDRTEEEGAAAIAHERVVQRMLFDAGLAGICVPREYGGQGLTPAHQAALNEELAGYEYPTRLQVTPPLSEL